MPPFVVRSATPADVPAIRAVAARTWRATYAGLVATPDIELVLERAYGADAVARTIDRLGDGYLVALAGETVVGYAIAGANRDGGGELFAIYVAPEAQSRGVGRALWRRAVAHLRSLGLDDLALWVAAGNAPARRFYQRQGAEPIGERVVRLGQSDLHEVRYRLRLGSGANQDEPARTDQRTTHPPPAAPTDALD
jgi:ribosomal protein S18 acetylase RimI-like enzyme